MLKPKKWQIAVIAIAGLTALVWLLTSMQATAVRLAPVEYGTIEEYIELRGKVALDRTDTVASKINGLVQTIYVKQGDRVAAGTALLALDLTDLNLALQKAQANAAAFRAVLDGARKDYQYQNDRLARSEQLAKDGAISGQELRDARNLTAAAASVLKNAQEGWKAAQLEVDDLQQQRGRSRVYAGLSGMVLSKLVEPGAGVQPGTPLFEIGDYASAYLTVDLLVDDVAKVRSGQRAVLSGDLLDQEKIEGTVFYIAPQAVTKVSTLGVEQQRIEVRIKYDTAKYHFKPGYALDVKLITGSRDQALFVPYKAVFDREGKPRVFVAGKNGKLTIRAIKKGIENNDFIQVLSGVKKGEQVVVDPASDLAPGMRVRPE